MPEPREIHQIEYRWHPVRDLYPVASSMSPESTRGWDMRVRSWVRHPPADAPTQSVCYQILPPNGAVAALAWRSRAQQASERDDGSRGRPLVSRVLVGNASLLTPDVAIALCRMGLPVKAGERPGQVAAGAELPTVSAAELDALVGGAVEWLDRETRQAAAGDGLSQVIAAAIADPNAPLAIGLPEPAVSRLPGDGVQARLLWGLWRITRPLLGTVRRGWSFSTFELPLGAGDPATVPDVVFRADATGQLVAPPGTRKEFRVVPGNPGELAGSSQAWLAEWLVAEYLEGGGEAVERLLAECGVEQPLQARLAAVYDLLHARWAHRAIPVIPEVPADPEQALGPEPTTAAEEALEPGADAEDYWDAGSEPERAPDPTGSQRAEPAPEESQPARSQFAEPGSLGPFRREGTPPPLPLPVRGSIVTAPAAGGTPAGASAAGAGTAWPGAAWTGIAQEGTGWAPGPGEPGDEPPRLYEPTMAPSVPDLLTLLAGTTDHGEFKLLLQDILTIGAEPELGNRVDARRILFEAHWCIDPSRSADRELHADELARIFQVIVTPDLDRPRIARELAEWAAVAPPAVIGGLLGAARGEGHHNRSVPEKYLAMMAIIQPVLAQRWLEANGLGAEWDPRLAARSRRDPGRGFLGFRKRG